MSWLGLGCGGVSVLSTAGLITASLIAHSLPLWFVSALTFRGKTLFRENVDIEKEVEVQEIRPVT